MTRASIHGIGLLVAFALATTVGVLAQGDAASVARRYVELNRKALGLSPSDVREIAVSSTVRNEHNGVTHVYLQQRYRGIEVHNGLITVSVRDNDVISTSASRFVANITAAAGAQYPRKEAADAAKHAAGHVNLEARGRFDVLARKGTADESTIISSAGVAERPIEAKLTWVETGSGVRLAWQVRIDEATGDHWWQALVDAETGESLGVTDLVVHDSVEAIVTATVRPADVAAAADPASAIASFPATDGARYNVVPIPFGSPSESDRVLVSNAADPAASPFGWHDTNGTAGPEFFVTRGNNVHAYTDIDANNVADPGSDPTGGGTLTFDFPLDLSQQPSTYRPAAVTNLFYWNNIVHDVMHGYGFDEASGNFQVNNYGGGGLGNDDVRAEAQDGSGTNNANFATNVDGLRPRMQMFVWTHPQPNFVTVNSPAAIAGDYVASGASFGAPITLAGLTGNVVLTNDGTGPSTSDGCEPLVGFPAGAIALVDRGTCEFGFKARTAQQAGASAAIIVNNAPGNPVTMGPGLVGNQVTIAAVMVSQADGDRFKANLPVNATVRLNPLLSINRDSDLDAGVIAHEYAHGISNRLTGGPAVAGCLPNNIDPTTNQGRSEQMGEGWSDFFAITLTTDPSDTKVVPRGIGNYVAFEGRDGLGIRPTPYSTDMAVNPATYAFVANPAISQPHGIGWVWNTMLWDMYWNLVDRHGYNANVYDPWQTGGNNLTIQLVMDGMKFQPCRPGFVDGRNGILAADMALTGGENQCEIWRAFARRGLGFSANQGDSQLRNDGVAAFDLPASCTAATFGDFDSPVVSAPAVNTVDAGDVVPLKFTLTGAGPGLIMDSQPVDCTTLLPTGETPSALDAPGGTGLKQKDSTYHFNWQTDESWAGSCRRVTLRVPAASDAVAYFRFE
jgi:extracellular elastinolytic metalloproteinase